MRVRQEKILEAVLFASGESVPLTRLADAAGCAVPVTRGLLAHMAELYAEEQAGIQLIELDDAYRLCTNPLYYDNVKKLLRSAPHKPLTQTLLETLAIIAYKQPVTKAVIEEIRGVNADHSVNKLLEYGLIEERGRLEAPGKPIMFGTTEDFLKYYGYKNLDGFLAAAGEADGEKDSSLRSE
ncbi:MAG: SMC-Scp complex subunit ScpB [Clostridiales bacterium]|nr:SMC-Scp complex subunit ScpB [Clostridiales bacterium]